MQISVNFDNVPTPREVAARLRMVAGIWEGKSHKEAASDTDTDTDMTDDGETETTPTTKTAKKTTAKKAAAKTETDESEFDLGETLDTEEEEEETVKAISLETMISAFQAYAKKHTREKAGLVLKKYGVKSVRDLKPAQFAEVLKKISG